MSRVPIYFPAVICMAMLAACRTENPPATSIETFRPATRADLSLGILSLGRESSGFPLPIVNLRSLTEDEIIVTYGPGDLTIHCGAYVAHGPPATFGVRREILDSYGYMDFPPPTSGWAEISRDGTLQLLRPACLPPGDYDLWATFRIPGPDGGLLKTPHTNFSVSASPVAP
jgi:hypothetical protein